MMLISTYSCTNSTNNLLIMSDIIKTTVEGKKLSDLVLTRAPKVVSEPKLTASIVNSAITKLKDLGKNGGYGDIAKSVGHDKITKAQVKKIHSEMLSQISKLQADVKITR